MLIRFECKVNPHSNTLPDPSYRIASSGQVLPIPAFFATSTSLDSSAEPPVHSIDEYRMVHFRACMETVRFPLPLLRPTPTDCIFSETVRRIHQHDVVCGSTKREIQRWKSFNLRSNTARIPSRCVAREPLGRRSLHRSSRFLFTLHHTSLYTASTTARQ